MKITIEAHATQYSKYRSNVDTRRRDSRERDIGKPKSQLTKGKGDRVYGRSSEEVAREQAIGRLTAEITAEKMDRSPENLSMDKARQPFKLQADRKETGTG